MTRDRQRCTLIVQVVHLVLLRVRISTGNCFVEITHYAAMGLIPWRELVEVCSWTAIKDAYNARVTRSALLVQMNAQNVKLAQSQTIMRLMSAHGSDHVSQ